MQGNWGIRTKQQARTNHANIKSKCEVCCLGSILDPFGLSICSQDGPQRSQSAFKTPPRPPQERPRAQEASKSAQDASKTARRAPKKPPRRPQERPSCLQEPLGPPRARECIQEDPKSLSRPLSNHFPKRKSKHAPLPRCFLPLRCAAVITLRLTI